MPSYGHDTDAGFDLYATEDTTIMPGERKGVPTGIAIEIPAGYVGLIWDKSSVSFNHGQKTIGGVIDSGYHGEIKIGIYNFSNEPFVFEKGHKVAQMLIQKVEKVEFEESNELSDTTRGKNGWGSTGK